MPKLITLVNQHIRVEKRSEIDPEQSTDGEPVIVEVWTFTFTDKVYGDQIAITFPKAARDDIIKGLTGGVVLPGT